MKKVTVAVVLVYTGFLTLAAPCWAGGGKDNSPAVSGLVGLDAALDGAVQDIESRLPKGTPIVVTAITAPNNDAKDFLGDEISGRFKNLKPLAREAALKAVEKEQFFQLSGMVSDESAVGIGHFIGAKAVISGDMKRYADFTQLRLRIVDVETSQAFIYSARIANNDRLLANILPRANAAASGGTKVSDNALDHLNRGKDFFVEQKYDEAIQEFDQAIAIDSKFAEAYKGRGLAYFWKRDVDRGIEEFNYAIRLNPNDAEAYKDRGFTSYQVKSIWYTVTINDIDRAIADLSAAIRIKPDYAEAYVLRARLYSHTLKGDSDRGIADCTSAIRINPKDAEAYYVRGLIYDIKGDYDRAIADYTSVIRIDPNYSSIEYVYRDRGQAYEKKGDIDRAIADYETALRLGDNYIKSDIERLRKQRGR